MKQNPEDVIAAIMISRSSEDGEIACGHRLGALDAKTIINALEMEGWVLVPASSDAESTRLRAALTSIATSTCCDGCQEAARWARAALNPKPAGSTTLG